MNWVLRDGKAHVAGLAVSPTGRRSHLAGLRINSQSSDHLELAPNELWGSSRLLLRGDEFNIVGIKEIAYRQASG